MSRIGRMPIAIPAGVTITFGEGNEITVKGPKGELSRVLPSWITVRQEGDTLVADRPNDEAQNRELHGLTRTLVNNMVIGVTAGYSKELSVQGVGYRAVKDGKNLVLNVGYSHQVIVPDRPGLAVEVPDPGKIIVSGADKQAVGQFAAEIRAKRPPEPYKGKGIRYANEVVRLKEGKTAAAKK